MEINPECGPRHYVLGFITCHICLQRVPVSTKGKIYLHYQPFNGDHCPVCPTTDRICKNCDEIMRRDSEAPYGIY